MKQAIRLRAHGNRIRAVVCLSLAALASGSNLRGQKAGPPSIEVCSDHSKLAPLAQELGYPAKDSSFTAVRDVLGEISAQAYPELAKKELRLRTFHSNSDYFRTRFSISRFLLFRRMRYFVEVNPELFARKPPPDGVCAILGHELAHVTDLSRGNRLRLFGLVRLLLSGYTVRFERRADLEAIRRGFGSGLVSYRNWVYGNIPPEKVVEKKRNYFSPLEIHSIEERTKANPRLFDYWKRKVPLNEGEIEASVAPKK